MRGSFKVFILVQHHCCGSGQCAFISPLPGQMPWVYLSSRSCILNQFQGKALHIFQHNDVHFNIQLRKSEKLKRTNTVSTSKACNKHLWRLVISDLSPPTSSCLLYTQLTGCEGLGSTVTPHWFVVELQHRHFRI